MMQQKTPGVYVEEIPKLPASVAGVATAVPVFVGFTQKGEKYKAVKISNLLEYNEKFGEAPGLTISDDRLHGQEFTMNDSLRLFYDNGGGSCYIVSAGKYEEKKNSSEAYLGASGELFTELEKQDEITLVCFPDAAMILDARQLGTLHQQALKHCASMGDRFAILDPKLDKKLDNAMKYFRGAEVDGVNYAGVGTDSLNFGAAYYPYIKTAYSKDIPFDEMLKDPEISKSVSELSKDTDSSFYKNYAEYNRTYDYSKVKDNAKKAVADSKAVCDELVNFSVDAGTGKIVYMNDAVDDNELGAASELYAKIKGCKTDDNSWEDAIDAVKGVFQFEEVKGASEDIVNGILDKYSIEAGELLKEGSKVKAEGADYLEKILLDEIAATTVLVAGAKSKKDLLAKSMITQIEDYARRLAFYQDQASIITPCAAIAGLYCATDDKKGVWQAPANISIASAVDVTEVLSDSEQENMNVDPEFGKSVNAIRFFSGKGILVWGARTLDGNSNEWKYVPVRRLFNYVEESVKKSTAWAVFQPNDANTWAKIQCQIENFLTGLWRDGALAGATPDKAFYVKVGLGVTMTSDDINNGNLIVEIGLAAVRPAEFIILQFSHKVQE